MVNAKVNIKEAVVIPLGWEISEERLCATMPTAVKDKYPMLLCGGAEVTWNQMQDISARRPNLKFIADPVIEAIEGQERWFPVRFLGKGEAAEEIGKGFVIWKCTKHVDGEIECKW